MRWSWKPAPMPGCSTINWNRWWARSAWLIRLSVKLISAARVKTDARDTIKLARLLAANLIPAVWVPPLPVRELRALVTHRKRLVQQRIQARNRLQGVLQRRNLDAPEGKAFARGARDWWCSLPLSMAEQLRVQQDLARL